MAIVERSMEDIAVVVVGVGWRGRIMRWIRERKGGREGGPGELDEDEEWDRSWWVDWEGVEEEAEAGREDSGRESREGVTEGSREDERERRSGEREVEDVDMLEGYWWRLVVAVGGCCAVSYRRSAAVRVYKRF